MFVKKNVDVINSTYKRPYLVLVDFMVVFFLFPCGKAEASNLRHPVYE